MSEDNGNGDGIIPDPVPGPTVEPPNGEQIIDGDNSTSSPGSLPQLHWICIPQLRQCFST